MTSTVGRRSGQGSRDRGLRWIREVSTRRGGPGTWDGPGLHKGVRGDSYGRRESSHRFYNCDIPSFFTYDTEDLRSIHIREVFVEPLPT